MFDEITKDTPEKSLLAPLRKRAGRNNQGRITVRGLNFGYLPGRTVLHDVNLDIAPGRFSFMGNMFLRPAGVTVQARSVGGRVQIVRCEIDPQHFNATVEREFDWTESELRTCVNLRNDTLKTLFRRLNDELINPGLASAALFIAR